MLEQSLLQSTPFLLPKKKKEEKEEKEEGGERGEQGGEKASAIRNMRLLLPSSSSSSSHPPPPKPCQSSNFLRVFRHIPEVRPTHPPTHPPTHTHTHTSNPSSQLTVAHSNRLDLLHPPTHAPQTPAHSSSFQPPPSQPPTHPPTQKVVALGLLESSKSSPVQQRAEGTHRFFLSSIHAEERGKLAHGEEEEEEEEEEEGGGGKGRKKERSVVDSLYGYIARTTNTYIHPPNLPPKITETRSFVVELVYPRTLPTTSSPPPGEGGGGGEGTAKERVERAIEALNAARKGDSGAGGGGGGGGGRKGAPPQPPTLSSLPLVRSSISPSVERPSQEAGAKPAKVSNPPTHPPTHPPDQCPVAHSSHLFLL